MEKMKEKEIKKEKKIDVYIKILQKRRKKKKKQHQKGKKNLKKKKKAFLVFAIRACKSFLVEFHTP